MEVGQILKKDVVKSNVAATTVTEKTVLQEDEKKIAGIPTNDTAKISGAKEETVANLSNYARTGKWVNNKSRVVLGAVAAGVTGSYAFGSIMHRPILGFIGIMATAIVGGILDNYYSVQAGEPFMPWLK